MGSFFVCLQVFRRRPVIRTVIRLSRGHLLPASRPAGYNLSTTIAICPQRSINTQIQTALRGINRRPNSSAHSMLTCRMHCVAQPTPVFGCSI
ncbi:hypothetical protein LF1_57240 [Rubripirellula obstinata]|uniref:Uncharacterized protein n=1 Tax=Rubripirellula obstinata TaxID=406547 RepID=A0A5B1C7A7_9BACT|nr:hypothetical protein LF1_57240 [Rubripirellula obstinata]